MREARETGRCGWAYHTQEESDYHDRRWCKPVHDDGELFALLCLEGMQAGLSWALILKREKGIRDAFDGFDPAMVSAYGEEKTRQLMADERVIRNRRKIEAAISNAQAFLRVVCEFGSFDRYIWGFTGGRTVMHHPACIEDIPARDELSERVSVDLRKRGFKFVGPVIVYSYLQAIGMVNDHLEDCPFKNV